MSEKRVIDWEGIERDYRAGLMSLREISKKYSNDEKKISHVAIKNRSEKEGWSRDLRAKIQQKAEEIVNKAEVNGALNAEDALLTKVTENQIVQVRGIQAADVSMSQRRDVTRMRSLVIRLLEECEAEASNPSIFQELGFLLRSEDKNGQDKLNDAYHKAISLPSRIKGVKDLADALKTLIALEREAYGLSAMPQTPEDKPIDQAALEDGARRMAFIFAQAANKPQPDGAGHGRPQVH